MISRRAFITLLGGAGSGVAVCLDFFDTQPGGAFLFVSGGR